MAGPSDEPHLTRPGLRPPKQVPCGEQGQYHPQATAQSLLVLVTHSGSGERALGRGKAPGTARVPTWLRLCLGRNELALG